MATAFPTMIQENLSVSNGDDESPEWIVRNVVIDMAGYYAHNFATDAIINDEQMTYTITVFDEYRSDIQPTNTLDEDGNVVLTYQKIWRTMSRIAYSSHDTYDMAKHVANEIRTAVFDKDAGEIDAISAIAVIECAIFGKVMF